MSTNLENRVRGRQRKRESRRQASEAQREKNKGDISWWKNKMRNASGHQCKVKMTGSEKSEREHVQHFLQKTCN